MRCDIANAFNSIDRAAVLAALHDIHPELARSQHAWLQRPAVALTLMPGGSRATLRAAVGIPQGPLLAFIAALGPRLRLLPARSVTPLAFADDVLLICPRASALDDFAYW